MSNLAPTAITGTGVVTGTAQPTVNGSVTLLVVNTSSFIGTVFLETSLDGGTTYIRPATPVITGTLGTGPFTFSYAVAATGPAASVLHRLNCSAYTSGTVTISITEAVTPTTTGFGSDGRPVVNQALLGSTAGDLASAGEVGEYLVNSMTLVGATGIADAGTNGPPVASPVVCTLTALDTTGSFGNLQAIYVTTATTLGTGLAASTTYYTCNFNPVTGTFNLASTMAKAVAAQNGTGVADINVTVVGSGLTTYHQGAYLATTTAADICGLILPPGDYDVSGLVFPGNGTAPSTTVTASWIAQVGASAQPTTAATILAEGMTTLTTSASTLATNGLWTPTPVIRVSLAAAGYVVLVGRSTFSTNNNLPQGLLRARRVR